MIVFWPVNVPDKFYAQIAAAGARQPITMTATFTPAELAEALAADRQRQEQIEQFVAAWQAWARDTVQAEQRVMADHYRGLAPQPAADNRPLNVTVQVPPGSFKLQATLAMPATRSIQKVTLDPKTGRIASTETVTQPIGQGD